MGSRTKNTSIVPEAEFLVKFQEARTDDWANFGQAAARLFSSSHSLRGSLAQVHNFLRWRSDKAPKPLSLSALCKRIAEFQTALAAAGARYPDQSSQSRGQFINREIDGHEEPAAYAVYLLFIIGIAQTKREIFFSHHTFKGCGDFQHLVSELNNSVDRGCSLGEVSEMLRQFDSQRIAFNNTRHLGGMLELGSLDASELWAVLFKKQPQTEERLYRSRPSVERHMICYRFSSLAGRPRIVKSFVVFQSPGRKRDYFAFKVFYLSSNGDLRRSAGAIIGLGSTVACFGSSRFVLAEEQEIDSPGWQVPRGPKTMVFRKDTIERGGVFSGLLMSINEQNVPIASRIMCADTHKRHHREAGIGSFDPQELVSDLHLHTRLGRSENHTLSKAESESIWSGIVTQLEAKCDHTLITDLSTPFDLRNYL